MPVPIAFISRPRTGLALAFLVLTGGGARADVPLGLSGWNLGGALAVTSDYIYRGVSESNGHAAVQGDLHLATDGGTFFGLWSSSRDHTLEPGADALLELYLGHHFDLGTEFGATVSARSRYYLGASEYEPPADYQQLSLALDYLDRATLTLTAIPNAVRYWFNIRLSRAPAYVAEFSTQWLIFGPVFLTGGLGYYYSSGTGPGLDRATGYAYGNAGAACEYRSLRLEVGYYFAQDAAERSFPYPVAASRVAATLSWRF